MANETKEVKGEEVKKKLVMATEEQVKELNAFLEEKGVVIQGIPFVGDNGAMRARVVLTQWVDDVEEEVTEDADKEDK